MANCWRCGGEMSPYAARCNWCGRSTSASAFLQVLTLAAMVLAILVLAGVMPMASVSAMLPDGWLKKSPLPMQTAEVGGAGSGGGSTGSRARGGYGSVEERNREVERTRRETEAREKDQRARLTAAGSKCDSETRIDALAARHETWTREDLALIACRQVATGFSTDQLIAARGRPLRRIRPDGAATAEVWVYRDMRVVVEGDRAVSIRMQ